jgi:hypothetical protein
MKSIKLGILSLCVAGTILCVEHNEANTDRYSQEELEAVRIAWKHQENRIVEFTNEASQTNCIIECFSHGKHVATINPHNETISTSIDLGKEIILSYNDLYMMVCAQNNTGPKKNN